MNQAYSLSVVVAVQYASSNLPDIVAQLQPAAHPEVEFLFCSTPADAGVGAQLGSADNIRHIDCESGSLIPELWRDGILAATAPRVALTTAHCIPAADWVQQLLQQDTQAHPGIGGIIDNDSDAGARDWAVYILRYIGFAPPQAQREIHEIAADNAVYDRDAILQHPDLLQIGFWEPSFHARFRQAGQSLLLQPELRVVHRNRYSSWQFFQQRLAHGCEFGLARAREISAARRAVLIVLSPLLPGLFLLKIVRSVMQQRRYRSKLLTATPWLLFFLLAWGLGEARGYLASQTGNHKQGKTHEQ